MYYKQIVLNSTPKNLPQPLIFVSFSHKDKFLDKLLFDSEKKASFNGYFLCRSNWLIVIEAWSSLIENVHF